MTNKGTARPDPTDPHGVKIKKKPLINHDQQSAPGMGENLKTGKKRMDPINGPHQYH
jgi:hypothetical protein